MKMLYSLQRGGGVNNHSFILSGLCCGYYPQRHRKPEGQRGNGLTQGHLPTCVSALLEARALPSTRKTTDGFREEKQPETALEPGEVLLSSSATKRQLEKWT